VTLDRLGKRFVACHGPDRERGGIGEWTDDREAASLGHLMAVSLLAVAKIARTAVAHNADAIVPNSQYCGSK